MVAVRKKMLGKKEGPSVFSLLKPYSGMILVLLLFSLVSNGVNLVIPKIISRAIDSYTLNQVNLQRVVLEFSVAALLIFVFTYGQSIIQTLTSERAARDLRSKLAETISGQNYAYILKANPSKLLTNLTSDLDSI